MGFYMGVFNFFIVIPQILASAGLGLVMKHLLGGNPMNAVTLGGVSLLIASVVTSFVDENAGGVAAELQGKPEPAAPTPIG